MREKASELVRISARRSLARLDARWVYSVDHAAGREWYDSRRDAFRAALAACERGTPRVSYYEFCSVPQEREITIGELRKMAVEAAQEATDERYS